MQSNDLVITNRNTVDEAICTWEFFKEVNADAMDDAEFAAIEDILDKGTIYAEPPGAFAGWSVERFLPDASSSDLLDKHYLRDVDPVRE